MDEFEENEGGRLRIHLKFPRIILEIYFLSLNIESVDLLIIFRELLPIQCSFAKEALLSNERGYCAIA